MDKKSVCRAFANEQRIRLLKCLSTPKNVTEMRKYCSLSQSALSQHLRVLREADVVITRRKGTEIVYAVRNKTVSKIADLLVGLL